jgi:hypothetical protein
MAARRPEVVAGLAPGDRFPVLLQTLARFGLSFAERHAVAPFVTQASNSRQIDPGCDR